MDQQKVFEAVRLRIKLSKVYGRDKSVGASRAEIIDTIIDSSELLTEFKNSGDDAEFKEVLINMFADVVMLLDGVGKHTIFEMKLFPDIPIFPNGGLVGPLYGQCGHPTLFKMLNNSGLPINRNASVDEIEKQLAEAKDGLEGFGENKKGK